MAVGQSAPEYKLSNIVSLILKSEVVKAVVQKSRVIFGSPLFFFNISIRFVPA